MYTQYMIYLSPSLTFSNAIPPSTANMALYNIQLVESSDGDLRRKLVLSNAKQLYDGLKKAGFSLLGNGDHPTVNVKVGDRLMIRAISNLITQEGIAVSYSEYPEVALG